MHRHRVLSAVCCLLFAVCCLLSAVCCLLSARQKSITASMRITGSPQHQAGIRRDSVHLRFRITDGLTRVSVDGTAIYDGRTQ
ncbi:hypothetical protein LLE67_09640 [Xanthomonas campestris]|uniref:hypothetical protein n=1 Tax=Xanthomonas campestris TaxID=339 RepID=UPI001E3327E9|nr:hypothetical protein [Xanthomonas campestris]MCC5068095.1 hypothetical protein [Xanthomonas campestris]